jgi:uncharacterized membrane protein YfcA
MQSFWLFAIYFGAGVLQDIVITFYYRFVADKKAGLSAMLSFIVTLINLTILYGILTNLTPESGIWLIVTYAVGNAVGAYLAVRFSKLFSSVEK